MTIMNAKDTPLSANPGTLPDMRSALMDWFQPLTFTTITKSVVNFVVVESKVNVTFRGVRQPMSPQRLMMKPEGQRAWKWETIHATPDLILKPDDEITFLGVVYRVMSKSDFKEYGYVLYEIVQGYTP